MKMSTNGLGDHYSRVSEPAGNSFVRDESEDSSTPIQSNGHRTTPASTLTRDSRKATFASQFITPGAIVDEAPASSARHSANSMRGKVHAAERKKSEARPRELRKAASMDQATQSQGQQENGAMQRERQIQRERFREAFLIFDRDNDGRITGAEMSRAMQSLGYRPSEKEIADMFDKADINRKHRVLCITNKFLGVICSALAPAEVGSYPYNSTISGNGTIEFEEFVRVMMNHIAEHNGDGYFNLEQELQAMFEIFDLNKDGRISAQELNYAMKTLGENLSKSELDDMMRTADSNGDGMIDFQEFQNLFRLYDQSFDGSNSNKMAVSTH